MVDPALVLAGTDTAGDLPQAPSAPVATTGTSIPQGALAQSPATVISGGLAEALTSTDSTQMQSRLQPYQAWAQRFGEVLAQKLSLAVKDGNWSVKLNLNPASLGPVGVELQVNNGGIEGQIAANDANVRQLLNDSLPRLRQSLEALVSDNASVNIELSDQRENGAKQQREPDVEIPLDLLAEEFIPLKEAIAGGNILRDGLSVFV
jgi:flagellar hook-length control protein FliK